MLGDGAMATRATTGNRMTTMSAQCNKGNNGWPIDNDAVDNNITSAMSATAHHGEGKDGWPNDVNAPHD